MSMLNNREKILQLQEVLITAVGNRMRMQLALDFARAEEQEAEEALHSAMRAEKTFDVYLADYGNNKIQVIKQIRELTNVGLAEAKEVTDRAGSAHKAATFMRHVNMELAEMARARIHSEGGVVEIRPSAAK